MLRKFTVQRIAPDYYTIDIKELCHGVWDIVGSIGGQWPEYNLPETVQKRNPRTMLKHDGDSYVFYACVYDFPEPRLMGKFADYTSAYGWEFSR